MSALIQKRIARAQATMPEGGLDLLFVNNRENLIYFTGLTQIECQAVLIPREGEACTVTLWLDAGYVRGETGLATYGYEFPRESLVEKCIERIKAFGHASPRIGFERYFVAFGVYDALRKEFSEKNFSNASDMFYRLRAIKDETELQWMRRAGEIVVAGMEAAAKSVRIGLPPKPVEEISLSGFRQGHDLLDVFLSHVPSPKPEDKIPDGNLHTVQRVPDFESGGSFCAERDVFVEHRNPLHVREQLCDLF